MIFLVEGCYQEQGESPNVPQSKPPIMPRKLKPPLPPRTTHSIYYQPSEEDQCMKNLSSSHCTADVSLPNSKTVARSRSHTVDECSGYQHHDESYRRRLKTHEMVVLKKKKQERFVYIIKLLQN